MNRLYKISITLLFTGVTFALATGLTPVKEINVRAPDIESDQWLNSEPLDWSTLKDRVVLVEFWTFGCYNCKNVEPYIKQWYKKYESKGLEIIAVHSPEFDHERDINNVKDYIKDHGITYPVAIDNDFIIWRSYSNRYWPAMYLVDKRGIVRYRFIGEGNYELIEKTLFKLLHESS